MLVQHRGTFGGILFQWRGSALAQIWPALLAVLVFSLGLTWAHQAYRLEWLELPTAPFTVVGLALSIFLGFRNQACYQRWWEGRILWGRLVNASRSYARQVLTLISDEEEEAQNLRQDLLYLMIGFVHALRLRLREQPLGEELSSWVPAPVLRRLHDERNRPNALTHLIGEQHRRAFDRGWIHPFHLPILEQTLTEMTAIQGACERIKSTPVPLTYTELTHRIVALYVLFLPFGMIGSMGHLTPPLAQYIAAPLAVGVVAFAFLGLDAVGSQIENPFEEDPNDLPLSQLSRMIENDLRTRLGETQLHPDVKPVDGILL